MTNELSVRFYLKCVDNIGKATTYRFNNETALKKFLTTIKDNNLAIIDTHIASLGVELLTPPFGIEVSDIDHMDINLAKEWEVDTNEIDGVNDALTEPTIQENTPKLKKDKTKKDKKLKNKDKTEDKKDKKSKKKK